MDSVRKTKHEQDEYAMREAALRIVEAPSSRIGDAVSAFMQAEIDWFNSIPRDARAIPLTRAA